jgi:phytoene dehydrogenase-like protein
MPEPLPSSADVVVVGGGHNGLAAAAYLAQAGYDVVVLERGSVVGGAAISAQAFDGVDAQLSRYSYLVSLMPERIRSDLALPIQLIRRRYSSYTPVPGETTGLLIDAEDAQRTKASFDEIGASSDYDRWVEFYRDTEILAQTLFPTMTDPLLRESEVKSLLETRGPGRRLWERFFDTPIRRLVHETFEHDIVRGVVLTDALIGTFPDSDDDASLGACFLYHVIGGGTGDWDVPVGGMGAVSGSLERAARNAGAKIVTDAVVSAITDEPAVEFDHGGSSHRMASRLVVSGISRDDTWRLAGVAPRASTIEGAQVKVNLLLARLPRLNNPDVSAEEAFGGTFHINESGSQLDETIAQAQAGEIPEPIPCEVYCHSLSDRSILGEGLRESTAQTLTVFALNVPHRLIAESDPDSIREELQERVLRSLQSVLAEPLDDCLLRDANGQLCIETKTTLDLEKTLGLPGGNIFHEPLGWPFVPDSAPLDSPAERWGVDSGSAHILLAGSSARRGGGVSAIGGHNAAMAALELLA